MAQLKAAYAAKQRNYLLVELEAPTIVIPKSVTDPLAHMMVVDLGSFEVGTKLQPLAQAEEFKRTLGNTMKQLVSVVLVLVLVLVLLVLASCC